MCRRDGIGRRAGLKIPWWQHRIGSTPIAGTKKPLLSFKIREVFHIIRGENCPEYKKHPFTASGLKTTNYLAILFMIDHDAKEGHPIEKLYSGSGYRLRQF